MSVSIESGRGLARQAGADTVRPSRILVVRHGAGRDGRVRLPWLRPRAYQQILDRFAVRFPGLRAAIDTWDTGTPPPPALEPYAAVLFLLGDPLKELFPRCYAEASALAAEASRLGIRLVNPPDALSNTIKSRQAALLLAAGIPTPKHYPFTCREELAAAARQVRYPAILRADLLHAQESMTKCYSESEVLALAPERVPFPGALAELVDTREGFRHTRPGTPWATHFHKKRAYVFGNHVVNNHMFFGLDPIVGGCSSTFGHYRSLNPIRRTIANARCREHIALDYAYFREGEEHAALLRKAARALELEFVAIDYASTAEGGVVVWEANPHFCFRPWPFQVLARKRKVAERYLRFEDAMRQFFLDLLEEVR